jgi:hypothetical protein
VEEVRRFRMEHTREFTSDLLMICEDLRRFESSLADRVVMLQPRKIQPTRKSGRLHRGQGRSLAATPRFPRSREVLAHLDAAIQIMVNNNALKVVRLDSWETARDGTQALLLPGYRRDKFLP